MKRNFLLSIGRTVLGVILLVVGLLALFTPLTPGSWLAIIGLQLLGWGWIWHDWIKPKLKKAQKKGTEVVKDVVQDKSHS